MEQYELLQDLPFANKGDMFYVGTSGNTSNLGVFLTSHNQNVSIKLNTIKDFDKWFKKVKWKPKNGEEYYVIKFNDLTIIEDKFYKDISLIGKNVYSPFYQTYEEAEEKLNKIKEILNN